ncbi:MAG TPA: DUF6011 domain-containing protein [Solirubrobacterales bacterium]
MVDFSDLDDLDTAAVKPTRDAGPQPANTAPTTIRCPKCKGSGRFVGFTGRDVGPCNPCKGTGQVSHDYDKRKAAYEKGQRTRASNEQRARAGRGTKADQWREQHPAESAWIDAAADRGFRFAESMREALGRWGSLSDGQMGTVQRLMGEDAARAEQQAGRAVELGGAAKIRETLMRAVENGLKKPKLRCGALSFDWPRQGTKNPGCIYVVEAESDTYLGKINPSGVFEPAFRCTDAQRQTVLDIAADPLSAAIAHGKESGRCACCGRELTDPESIERGIGPICATKFFGA